MKKTAIALMLGLSMTGVQASTITADDYGAVDLFLVEADKVGSTQAEADWVNDYLGTDITFTVKNEDVVYHPTDIANIFAFNIAEPGDYFIVKNSTRMALFENYEFLDWGVFNTALLSDGMNLPDFDEYTISHVTQFGGPAVVPAPGALLLMLSGLMGLVGFQRFKT